MTAEGVMLQGGVAAPKPSNNPYPNEVGQGAAVGGRHVNAAATGTLRTAARARSRSAGRSSSVPGRHAAAREAAREQRMVEEHYAKRRADSPRTPRSAISPRTPRSPKAAAAAATPSHQNPKKEYGAFDYSLKREQPHIRRDPSSGRAVISPRQRSKSPASRRSLTNRQQRAETSPRRGAQTVKTGEGLWLELCHLAQYDFTCEELCRLHVKSLVNLAVYYGLSTDPTGTDLFLLEEYHASVQTGSAPIRPMPSPANPGQPQEPRGVQSQRLAEYTHLNYGMKRDIPATRRDPHTDRPVVTKKQQIEFGQSTRSMRSA